MPDSNNIIASADLKELLDEAVARINVTEFAADDPVQFPRRFAKQADAEIVSLLCAMIAWGRRPMILRDCQRLIDLMHGEPLQYVLEGDWELLPDTLNIHRTMFASHLKYLMRGFKAIYSRYSTLDEFCGASVPAGAECAPWVFTENLLRVMQDNNDNRLCPECIPSQLDKTALKRINMALRWLVRDDGIVDMGLWRSLKPCQLYIPLDVHVANTSRRLGLLQRRSNDRRAVELLTESLKQYDASDPCRYDFALFGLGITGAIDK